MTSNSSRNVPLLSKLCSLLFTRHPTCRNTPAQPHFPMASATTESNSLELKSCETNPQECTGQQTPTAHKLSCSLEKHQPHRMTRDCVSVPAQCLGHPAQDTQVSITLLTPAVASCSDNTHSEGGNKYIHRVSAVNAPKRETKLHLN